ncbi:sulfotransferase family 2 domain-containing protein [Paracoccus alkenifer]|uniref:Sulfotransferase family protein n=1 Tax=Paracoccus alkenifer TaxID=65735 RepID=A0A1H6JS88_9RHOB|nr:sulfotransferase family 2 domain-containing protein [Paracoccus alkenifer]SEH61949.1 Sulfotransferase family protein [Paracoccus alkenifer]
MIISRGRAYVFVHIPKTGGTALSLALESRAMRDDIILGDTPKARARARRQKSLQAAAGRLRKHATLADIDGLVTPQELARMFVVTLVRNPWDRLVSYYHWLRGQRFDHPAVAQAQALGFGEFLHHPQTQAAFRAWPYGAWLRDRDGVERCDAWVRLEHLAEDLAPFERHLGFALDMGRANVSDRDRDWRRYYSDADATLVAQLCAVDIARFGYRFDPEAGG